MAQLTHKILSTIASVVLSAYAAFNLHAQERPPGPRPTPKATPVTKSFPPLGNPRIIVKQASKTQLNPGIFGSIRWKKEYGFPSIDGGATPDKNLNCGAFRVEATVQEGAPGTFGSPQSVGYYLIQNEPTEDNDYYICRYSFTDQNPLPRNQVIRISAFIGAFVDGELNRALTMKPWFGEGQPQPPYGYQRVPIGSRGVTLSDNKQRVTVDFEMVYRPIPATPR